MRHSALYFCAALAVIIAPTAFALGNYAFNDNAARPFDFYRQAAQRIGFFRTSDIVVTLHTNKTAQQRKAFETAIRNTFAARDYYVEIRHMPKAIGHIDTLTIRVGTNRYGPYPNSNSSAGIRAALAAQNMRNR